MSLSKQIKGFDRLSGVYDILGLICFGNTLNQSQYYFLNKIPSVDQILVVGGGTGSLLIKLLDIFPTAHITWVDISPKMIEKTKARVKEVYPSQVDQINFINGILSDSYDKKFDLICCMYILDCFNESSLDNFITLIKHYSEEKSWPEVKKHRRTRFGMYNSR